MGNFECSIDGILFDACPWKGSPELRKSAIVSTPPLSVHPGEVTAVRVTLRV
jgi:hypothetical protein